MPAKIPHVQFLLMIRSYALFVCHNEIFSGSKFVEHTIDKTLNATKISILMVCSIVGALIIDKKVSRAESIPQSLITAASILYNNKDLQATTTRWYSGASLIRTLIYARNRVCANNMGKPLFMEHQTRQYSISQLLTFDLQLSYFWLSISGICI